MKTIFLEWKRFLAEGEDYRGEHRAPSSVDGAPLWNVSANGIYPQDFYGPNGFRYYRPGENYDSDVYAIIRKAWGRRDQRIPIYRAVPPEISEINPGDWVAIHRQYALDHGESALGGEYKILKKVVSARDLFTAGDSFHEWGYDPQPRVPYSEREEWERWPGKGKDEK